MRCYRHHGNSCPSPSWRHPYIAHILCLSISLCLVSLSAQDCCQIGLHWITGHRWRASQTVLFVQSLQHYSRLSTRGVHIQLKQKVMQKCSNVAEPITSVNREQMQWLHKKKHTHTQGLVCHMWKACVSGLSTLAPKHSLPHRSSSTHISTWEYKDSEGGEGER